jgi:predicted nucleic acid-binding protein
MVYLDTSVALAHLLGEDRRPADSLWDEALVSSRLLEYELWTRIHARRLERTHGELVRALMARVAILELIPEVLGRATDRFPRAVRTLDALHLATVLFLRSQGQRVRLASYDARLVEAASSLRIGLYPL